MILRGVSGNLGLVSKMWGTPVMDGLDLNIPLMGSHDTTARQGGSVADSYRGLLMQYRYRGSEGHSNFQPLSSDSLGRPEEFWGHAGIHTQTLTQATCPPLCELLDLDASVTRSGSLQLILNK